MKKPSLISCATGKTLRPVSFDCFEAEVLGVLVVVVDFVASGGVAVVCVLVVEPAQIVLLTGFAEHHCWTKDLVLVGVADSFGDLESVDLRGEWRNQNGCQRYCCCCSFEFAVSIVRVCVGIRIVSRLDVGQEVGVVDVVVRCGAGKMRRNPQQQPSAVPYSRDESRFPLWRQCLTGR